MTSPLSLATNVMVFGALAYLVFDKFNPPSTKSAPLSREAHVTEAPTSGADPAGDIAALRHALARQQEEIASMRAELSKNEPAVVDRAAAQDDRNPRTPANIEALRAERQAHMADVQADFFMERVDPKWSATMTNTIRSVAERNEAIRSTIDSIECHSRTCRVELKDDGTGKAIEQLPMFVQQVGGDLPYMESQKIDDGHGAIKTILYLSESTPGV